MSVSSALPRDKAIARILELAGSPEIKNDPPWLVVTVGLPGSGKSTFARKLAARTGATRLESDAIRRALFQRPTHHAEESKQLFNAIHAAAEQLLRGRANVILDATNLRERDRAPLHEIAARTGANILMLHFRASEGDIAGRLSARGNCGDPEDNSTADMAVYARMAETEEPLSCAHWKIDTSNAVELEAALERAIATLGPERHAAAGPQTGGSIS
jgi:predicted kinase